MNLNKEEKELLDSVERGEWKTIPDFEREKERFQEIARNTHKKNKRVNIRISEKDLINIQRKALEEGLPYQTYMSSILHKFIGGKLIEKPIGVS